ncbi:flagellar hook-basal body protein [Parageobacillus toebii]|nr:flagellar biosynthesis protein FlgG [Parageobacillus yumthangensis]PUF90230.1 flagellar hook-basal body protein [Geobacillus sp. LYN3]RDV22726.1 flagellar hook-basal body protein [Parageobacillus toebii]TXK88957.1 flagellar hook-basal body protein [Geobacillus sp. AYS3]TXK91500.1 flagellar hook-basal body protein [Parageobacillus sp. SY1]
MITAANTMAQLGQQLDVISNNIANSNTTGFKRRETNFGELLAQQFTNLPNDKATRLTPNGVRYGVGARLAETNLVLAQGALTKTDRALDVALAKEGQFFRVLVQGENGAQEIGYTRSGAFYLTPSAENPNELMLVTSDGHPVLDENNAPILLPEGFKNITISNNGTITAVASDGRVMRRANIGITTILRPQLLQSVGDNIFTLPDLNALNVNEADVAVNMIGNLRNQISMTQGALEQSNVDLGTELTDMMITERSYQLNARAISLSDQMLGLINGIRSS